MCVLTIDDIKRLEIIQLDEGQEKDEKKCYSNASYDFRLGDEYYVPRSDSEKIEINNSETIVHCPYKTDELNNQIKQCSKDNHVLRIKPFTSIVISTYEKLNMPNNVAGRFDLRVQWALQGLVLQVGTQIEPGYQGRLFGLLHNFSKKEICIPTMSRFLTSEFSYTTKDVKPVKKDGKEETPLVKLKEFLSKYPVIDGTLENYLVEIKTIDNKYRKSIEDQTALMNKAYTELLVGSRFKSTLYLSLFAAIITLALSIVIPVIITKTTLDRDDYPFQGAYEVEFTNKLLSKKVYEMEIENKLLSEKIEKMELDFGKIIKQRRSKK